jgi:hypothetical protein
MELHILSGEKSGPFFKVKGQISLYFYFLKLYPSLKFGHNFLNIEDSNLIFGMHVYLMKLHILSGERSRSSFKVKSKKIQSEGSNKL